MTFNDVFSGKLNVGLKNASNMILTTLRTRSEGNNYKQLEIDLNNFFYRQNNGNLLTVSEESALKGNLLSEYAIVILNTLESGSISEFRKFNAKGNAERKMLSLTLEKEILNLQIKVNQLESGISDKNNTVDAENARKALEEIKAVIESAIDVLKRVEDYSNKSSSKSYFKSGTDLNEATRCYNLLRTYNNILQNFNSLSQASGEILERYLKIFGNKRAEWEQEIAKDIIAKSFSRLTAQDTKSRGGGIINLTQINIQNFNANENYNLVDHISSNNLTMDVKYNTGAEKQIKMDVELFFSGGNYEQGSDFRISAKNWARGGAYGSLGETNLLSALSRSIQKQEEFSLGMLSNYQQSAAFALGKLSIMADIATGLSQREGYANTLVVNTGSRINVINLGKVIEQAVDKPLEEISGLTLHGYFFDPLKETALTTYKEGLRGIKTPGRTNMFLRLYYGYLKNIKVSMSINSNIFNQGTKQT